MFRGSVLRKNKLKRRYGRGFTLIEVLLAVSILAFVLCGLLSTYISLFYLGDISRQIILVTNAMQARFEEAKNTSFDALPALNGTTFTIPGFANNNARGQIQVNNTVFADLREVRIVVSFRSKGATRIIGEDTNLNGVLDSGEDGNNNGRLDSPMEIITLIAR